MPITTTLSKSMCKGNGFIHALVTEERKKIICLDLLANHTEVTETTGSEVSIHSSTKKHTRAIGTTHTDLKDDIKSSSGSSWYNYRL
ncbi:hypothetical protein AC249_AIPGENE4023 [Exaiptasia diaphana]|nr:hypothetical protein AC249_AIPGENE4023 [Exaiptasia diaphana]